MPIASRGEVGVKPVEPFIDSLDIEKDGNNIRVKLTLVHENGVNSISNLSVKFSAWVVDGNRLKIKNDGDELTVQENEFKDLQYRMVGNEEDNTSNDYMIEMNFTTTNLGYDNLTVEMTDIYGQKLNDNYRISSPIPGRLSYFTYTIIGLSVYGIIQKKVKGEKSDG